MSPGDHFARLPSIAALVLAVVFAQPSAVCAIACLTHSHQHGAGGPCHEMVLHTAAATAPVGTALPSVPHLVRTLGAPVAFTTSSTVRPLWSPAPTPDPPPPRA